VYIQYQIQLKSIQQFHRRNKPTGGWTHTTSPLRSHLTCILCKQIKAERQMHYRLWQKFYSACRVSMAQYMNL